MGSLKSEAKIYDIGTEIRLYHVNDHCVRQSSWIVKSLYKCPGNIVFGDPISWDLYHGTNFTHDSRLQDYRWSNFDHKQELWQ